MITIEQCDKELNPLGYTRFCQDGLGNPTYTGNDGISISINLKDNSFHLTKVIDRLFTLNSGWCSPFISSEYRQFDKIYRRFYNSAAVWED